MQFDLALHSFIKTRVASENMTDIIITVPGCRQISLLSISSHFSTRLSQVRCELANYVSKFGIGRELRNKVRKFISMFELRL